MTKFQTIPEEAGEAIVNLFNFGRLETRKQQNWPFS